MKLDLFGQAIPESYYPWEYAREWLAEEGVEDPLTETEAESAWLGDEMHQRLLAL